MTKAIKELRGSPGTQRLLKDPRLYLIKITSLFSEKAFCPQICLQGRQVPFGVSRPWDAEQGAQKGGPSSAQLLPRNMK